MHDDQATTRDIDIFSIIPNQWYGVLESHVLKKRPVSIQRLGEKLVLYRRSDGRVGCFLDRCPHRGVALSRGRVRGDELECGYHGFRFASDGQCTSMPCEGASARIPKAMRATAFATREAHGLIWLWWGADAKTLGLERLPDVPWIPEIPDSCRYTSQTSFAWPALFHRTIEANFDPHHAPVLHPQFGRHRTFVDALECVTEDDRIDMRCAMCSPEDRSDAMPFAVRFRFPGVSYFEIDSWLRFTVVDSPIDDRRTWRYVRYYNVRFPVPILGKLWVEFMMRLDYLQTQLLQDRPMIKTMAIPRPGIYADKLVRADTGIAQYIQRRQELLRQALRDAHTLPPVVRRHLDGADRSSPSVSSVRNLSILKAGRP